MRTAPLAFAILLSACGKPEPPAAPKVADLPSLKPASGGELVLVPAGGSISPFYVDRTLVTQELYEKVMGVNPSKRKERRNPVERVQWTDAARFLNRCSEMDGLAPCYDLKTWECDFAANGYRLPTEAEWEHACRAGGKGKYFFGDDAGQLSKYAWFKPGSGGQTRPVGQKLPNAWGLYDMLGNVWQWCDDWHSASKEHRVLRGGAWDSSPDKLEVAYRSKEFPVFGDACFGADSYGFRRVRNPGGAVGAARAPSPVEVAPVPAASPAPAAPGAFDAKGLKGTIVFATNRGGALDIWRMHASGRDPKPLTNDPHPDADPRFSPDGKKILYTSLRGGFPEVWVMSRDGGEPRQVTKGAQADWSPDAKAIVFIRDNQAFVRDLGSGAERRVTPEGWERCGTPAWSPDGKQIAIASRHEQAVGIYLLPLDGAPPSKLKTEEASCTPRWSADAKRLLCQTVKGHVHQVEPDGRNWEQVTFGADVQHEPEYSPDGTLVLFCRAPTPEGPWQICVRPLDGDDFEFARLTTEGSNTLPDWHPLED